MPAVSSACRLAAALLAATMLSSIAIAQTPASQAPATPPAPPAAATPRAPTAPEPGYKAPRTTFGHPSLEGVWSSNFVLPLEATPQTPMLVVPEAAAKQIAAAFAKGAGDQLDRQLDPEVPEIMRHIEGLAVVRGERRTRAVIDPPDGKVPYTPEGRRDANRGQGIGGMDNPEERPNWERCVRSLAQPPVFPIGPANPRYLVQTPKEVIVYTEYGGEARIIPFTDKHKPKMFWSFLGDAIAKWEGDTLVIETVGLPDKDRVRLFPSFVVTSQATVTERYTRLSDKELLYQFTVLDPSVYTAPWTAEFSVYRTSNRIFEHACHEGNYAMSNILKGARVKEERAKLTPVSAPAKPPAPPVTAKQ
jgi:hypothetical protein